MHMHIDQKRNYLFNLFIFNAPRLALVPNLYSIKNKIKSENKKEIILI